MLFDYLHFLYVQVPVEDDYDLSDFDMDSDKDEL